MTSYLKEYFRQFVRREEGAALSEYGLLLALIVIAIAVAGTTLATSITTFLNGVGTTLEAQTP